MSLTGKSLKTKLLLPLLAVVSVALTIIAVDQMTAFKKELNSRLRKRAEQLNNLLQFIAGSASRPEELQRLVSALGGEPDVKSIVVVANKPTKVIAATRLAMVGRTVGEISDPETREELQTAAGHRKNNFHHDVENQDIDFSGPISVSLNGPGGNVLERGAILISLDTRYLQRQLLVTMTKAILTSLATVLLIAAVCWSLLHRHVFRPMSQIGEAMQGFQAGDKDRLIRWDRFSEELAHLASAWNSLVDRLHREHAERTSAESALQEAHDQLESRVAERTAELREENEARVRTEEELLWKTAFLEAQCDSSLDGILVVDPHGMVLHFNRGFTEIWSIPATLLGQKNDELFLAHVVSQIQHPQQFLARVGHLYAHPTEIGRDEIETVDGRLLDRYSSPVSGADGRYYGRIWTFRDITDQKKAVARMEAMHRELLETSRAAGMAEVATSVLHNVGNVLNSVNVSATLVSDSVKRSKVSDLEKLAGLFDQNATNLGAFLSDDPRGRKVPAFLRQLSAQLTSERETAIAELHSLRENIEHIKDIVSMQQSYARVSGVVEVLPIVDLVEDSLRMNSGALNRHGVRVVREYRETPSIRVEKHKVLQILVNLIRNAKYACDEAEKEDKQITLRTDVTDGCLRVSVIDNGVGIPPENQTRIFQHGFTTRKEGHGFGLHSGALAAMELGGTLHAQSDGLGTGATFTLELPLESDSH